MIAFFNKCKVLRYYIVGGVVLLCTLLIIYKIFYSFAYNKNFYFYKAYFSNGEGLSFKTPIMLYGYKIGNIKEVYLDKEYNPVALLAIDKKIIIPDDSTLSVKENGFVGEKLLQLNLGISETNISNNSTITYTNSGVSLLTLVNMLVDYVGSIKKRNVQ